MPLLIHSAQVNEVVPEMSSDAAAKIWDDTINRKVFDLVHSQNNVEKLGGITAIGASAYCLIPPCDSLKVKAFCQTTC